MNHDEIARRRAWCDKLENGQPFVSGKSVRDPDAQDVRELVDALDASQSENARLQKYDAELTVCTAELRRWPLASGCNGNLQVAGHIRALLDALEAAQSENARLQSILGAVAEVVMPDDGIGTDDDWLNLRTLVEEYQRDRLR